MQEKYIIHIYTIMKRLFFYLALSTVIISAQADDNDIPIQSELGLELSQKNEGKSDFHASLQDDKTVIVESSESTDFSVEITDNNSGTVVYDGSTYNGSQHETDTLPEGDYTIKITTSEGSYSGEFNIE